MIAHFATILEENAQREAAICEEALCDMRITTVLHRSGGGEFDDHVVTYLRCKCHGQYYVISDFVSGHVDIRPMTPDEVKRYG